MATGLGKRNHKKGEGKKKGSIGDQTREKKKKKKNDVMQPEGRKKTGEGRKGGEKRKREGGLQYIVGKRREMLSCSLYRRKRGKKRGLGEKPAKEEREKRKKGGFDATPRGEGRGGGRKEKFDLRSTPGRGIQEGARKGRKKGGAVHL